MYENATTTKFILLTEQNDSIASWINQKLVISLYHQSFKHQTERIATNILNAAIALCRGLPSTCWAFAAIVLLNENCLASMAIPSSQVVAIFSQSTMSMKMQCW